MKTIMFVLVLALSACGASTPTDDPSSDTEECLDADAGEAASENMTEELVQARQALGTYDFATVAVHTSSAANYARDAADAAEADPDVSEPMNEAARELDQAAALMAIAGPTDADLIDEATVHLTQASASINEATDELASTDAERC